MRNRLSQFMLLGLIGVLLIASSPTGRAVASQQGAALPQAQLNDSETDAQLADLRAKLLAAQAALAEVEKSKNQLAQKLKEAVAVVNQARAVHNPEEILRLNDPKTRRQIRTLLQLISTARTFYPDESKTGIDPILTAAATGITNHLDRFTRFVETQEKVRMDKGLEGTFVGVGILVSHGGDHPMVLAPIYSGPAFAAGLRAHDKILAVDGESTQGFTAQMLAEKVRGVTGTPVTLTIERAGWEKPKPVKITRRQVSMDLVHHEVLPGGLGYIRIVQFGPGVPEGLDKAMADLEKQGALKGLIIDLRNNPGGTVNATVGAVSRFIKPNSLVSTLKGKAGRWARPQKVMTLKAGQVKTRTQLPMVVLINRRSASGSEMFSGALRDHKRAILIGETSFGKGSGQYDFPLGESKGKHWVHLTVFKYYLPNGESIHEVGLKPDLYIPDPPIDEALGKASGQIIASKALADYAFKWTTQKPDLIQKLIADDGQDESLWPDFDRLYKEGGLGIDRQKFRILLRNYLRRRIADDRKAQFLTDPQEDKQLQRAIYELGAKINLKLEKIPLYKPFAGKPEPVGEEPPREKKAA